MSRTILAEVEGFTPVIDTVVNDLGLMAAVVFGRMWRYCQMEDEVCKASLESIGDGIGVDKATVMRYAKELCDAGYLKDLTPDLRNRPHVYVDTGKAGIELSISGVAQSNSKKKTVAQSNVTVADCNTGVAESKLNKVFKKDSNIAATGYQKFSQKVTDERKEMLKLGERIEATLGVSPDWNNKKWEKTIRGIMKKEEGGQPFEQFVRWLKSGTEYNRPKAFQIAKDPGLILNNWAQAFMNAVEGATITRNDDGSLYV